MVSVLKGEQISVKIKMYDNNFLGKNNFIWFNGVVEDVMTTETWRLECVVWVFIQITKMTYSTICRGRNLIHPITSSGISGLGSSPGFIVEGTWVFGYFRDGYAMQERGNRNFAAGKRQNWRTDKGFYGPNGVYPKYKDEVDTNRLALMIRRNFCIGLELRKLTRRTKCCNWLDFDAVDVRRYISVR